MTPGLAFAVVFLAAAMLFVWSRLRRYRRAEYIRTFNFPPGLYQKLVDRRPELTLRDCALVARGLRQFFLAYLASGRKFVSMPSQVADDLWHEFILYTRNYQEFCRHAFGDFLHHTPAVVLGAEQRDNAGLRRVWSHSCKEENINPRKATRLPLLFALDTKLNIANGFRYAPDCTALRQRGEGVYCAGDFGDSSVDGSVDGFGDASPAGGDSGSGCGGGGCGGGGD